MANEPDNIIDFTIDESNKIANLDGKMSVVIAITSLNFIGTAALIITLITMLS